MNSASVLSRLPDPDVAWIGIPVAFLYLPVLSDPTALIARVRGGEPDVVFLEMEEENSAHVLRFLKPLRHAWSRARILVGGVAATLSAGELLDEYAEIDFVVVGEREEPLLAAFERLQTGRSLRDVPGVLDHHARGPNGDEEPDHRFRQGNAQPVPVEHLQVRVVEAVAHADVDLTGDELEPDRRHLRGGRARRLRPPLIAIAAPRDLVGVGSVASIGLPSPASPASPDED